MEYLYNEIEARWREVWNRAGAYRVSNDSHKPSYYVLDMFPYPSGAGLHVGHPLGYIASDVFARFKRLQGFNVLHPMGYDAFGLPAEQYALEHGVHPAVSTEENISNFRRQLDKIGFSFDWSREVKTSDPHYYRWTQWIFLQLFHSWYNPFSQKAEPITGLVAHFEKKGNREVLRQMGLEGSASHAVFEAGDWNGLDEKQKEDILMGYRLAYCSYGEVNWCEALGTVLANDEVVNGLSERGGFPVVKKKLRQWYLRITAYADRLLEGLAKVDFSEAMKEMQTNWIGKSFGCEIDFEVPTAADPDGSARFLKVYTTRPDTIFGVDFMVISPEHEMVERLTTAGQRTAVEQYLQYVQSRSERERMAEKRITGCFTGSFAKNPFDGKEIPVWISEYVLAGYGTGAIMAVPCGDERDFRFAQHFHIPITNILGDAYDGTQANATKEGRLDNSGFLTGMDMGPAMNEVIERLEKMGRGKRKVNFKMRDAAFSRQRYWGEPFPIVWKDGIAHPLDESRLPLELPQVESYRPGPEGEGPLANVSSWTDRHLETNTMPGYAGSSWYFLRYMDPANDKQFCSRAASDYWGQVDLYIGGTEHAVGHLLYSRMWTKVLYDLGYIGFEEPFKKLVNQGMIQGSSRFAYRLHVTSSTGEALETPPLFVSSSFQQKLEDPAVKNEIRRALQTIGSVEPSDDSIFSAHAMHVDVNLVDGLVLNPEKFRRWKPDYQQASFLLEDGSLAGPGSPVPAGAPYLCGAEVEKMSKSKFNTVNPDDLVARYGADTFRMYEMFLGPVEQSKPWDTKGIEGVHRFLKKLWRLFFDETSGARWTPDPPTDVEWKVLHRSIKKIEEDTERFSFNTAVSAFMITVNELTDLKCHKKAILQPLLVLLSPYAPHITEELYAHLQGTHPSKGAPLPSDYSFCIDAVYPRWEEKYLVESAKTYPVAVNGKTRTEISISLQATQQEVESLVLADGTVRKWLDGKTPKKVIYVKNKMINIVL